MKESTYVSGLSLSIEKEIGGKVYKLSDRSTLGLPDTLHIKSGVITFIETKISEDEDFMDGLLYVPPWKSVKKDIRQFEVCKEMSKNALVLFAIYYPRVKYSVVLNIHLLEQFRGEDKWLCNTKYLRPGNGLPQIKMFMEENKEKIHGTLNAEISY